MILYGIANCDSVKKARGWLAEHCIAYTFHDYKKVGVDRVALTSWIERLGWEALLNRAGTTFRKLPDADKQGLDADRALDLMIANPSTIKRPVLADGATLLVGFKPETYAATLASRAPPE